jgi:hypothetical protein
VWVVLVVQVVLAERVVLGHRNCPPVVAVGSTTRSTAVALLMGIVGLRTDLAVQLGETRCLIVKPARGSRLADRAAICPAIVLEAAEGIEGEDLVEAIDPEGPELLVEAIEGEALAEAQEAVETGVHLGGGLEGTTDQAHAPTAAEVPPAWELEVVAAAVVAAAADGGGSYGRRT